MAEARIYQSKKIYSVAESADSESVEAWKQTQWYKGLKVCRPGIVRSYDPERNTVSVQPAVTLKLGSNDTVSDPLLEDVPVLSIGGGGFAVRIPLKEGDAGWIMFNDVDISIFLGAAGQQGGSPSPSAPATYRTHDWADAIFIPDMLRKAAVNEAEAEMLVIQSENGDVRLAMGSEGISITGDVSVEGDLNVSGNIEATGTVKAAGNIESSGGDVIAGSVSLKTHVHGGVTTGSGSTSVPS